MSEKIRGFIPEADFIFAKENDDCEISFSTSQKFVNSIEVEITIIEPVYEYRFLLMERETDSFYLSHGYYKDLKECQDMIHGRYEAIRIIEETKRIRK